MYTKRRTCPNKCCNIILGTQHMQRQTVTQQQTRIRSISRNSSIRNTKTHTRRISLSQSTGRWLLKKNRGLIGDVTQPKKALGHCMRCCTRSIWWTMLSWYLCTPPFICRTLWTSSGGGNTVQRLGLRNSWREGFEPRGSVMWWGW